MPRTVLGGGCWHCARTEGSLSERLSKLGEKCCAVVTPLARPPMAGCCVNTLCGTIALHCRRIVLGALLIADLDVRAAPRCMENVHGWLLDVT